MKWRKTASAVTTPRFRPNISCTGIRSQPDRTSAGTERGADLSYPKLSKTKLRLRAVQMDKIYTTGGIWTICQRISTRRKRKRCTRQSTLVFRINLQTWRKRSNMTCIAKSMTAMKAWSNSNFKMIKQKWKTNEGRSSAKKTLSWLLNFQITFRWLRSFLTRVS